MVPYSIGERRGKDFCQKTFLSYAFYRFLFIGEAISFHFCLNLLDFCKFLISIVVFYKLFFIIRLFCMCCANSIFCNRQINHAVILNK